MISVDLDQEMRSAVSLISGHQILICEFNPYHKLLGATEKPWNSPANLEKNSELDES